MGPKRSGVKVMIRLFANLFQIVLDWFKIAYMYYSSLTEDTFLHTYIFIIISQPRLLLILGQKVNGQGQWSLVCMCYQMLQNYTYIFLSQNKDPSDFLDQKVTGPATSQNCLHFCFEITIPV